MALNCNSEDTSYWKSDISLWSLYHICVSWYQIVNKLFAAFLFVLWFHLVVVYCRSLMFWFLCLHNILPSTQGDHQSYLDASYTGLNLVEKYITQHEVENCVTLLLHPRQPNKVLLWQGQEVDQTWWETDFCYDETVSKGPGVSCRSCPAPAGCHINGLSTIIQKAWDELFSNMAHTLVVQVPQVI